MVRAMAACIAAAALLVADGATGHDWYPADCCSGHDCRAVPCEEIIDLSDGGVEYVPLHVRFGRDDVRISPNKDCHVCYATYSLSGQDRYFGHCVYIKPAT